MACQIYSKPLIHMQEIHSRHRFVPEINGLAISIGGFHMSRSLICCLIWLPLILICPHAIARGATPFTPVAPQLVTPILQSQPPLIASEHSNARIESLEKQTLDLQNEIQRIKDKSLTMFLQLVIFGIGAFAIAMAFASFLVNTWVKDKVSDMHKEEIKKTQEKLADITRITRGDIGARIFSTISGQCIDLYKNMPKPAKGGAHHDLYNSYVNMAVSISSIGYQYAQVIKDYIDAQNEADLTKSELCKYMDAVAINTNNYVFYLAQRGNNYDVEIVASLLPYIDKTAAEKQSENAEHWWSYKETSIWAKLHIGRIPPSKASSEIQAMLDNDDLPSNWKHDVIARYALYDRVNESNVDKINVRLRHS